MPEELIEVQDQASPGEVLDVELVVQRLRRAGLNDAKIVSIINQLFLPPAGHKNWTKSQLPSESPAQVPEGEAEDSSELSSELLLNSLRHGEMVNRLGCAKSTLSSAKERSDFPQWIKERDPDKIAWTWNKRAKVFVPVTDVPAPKSD